MEQLKTALFDFDGVIADTEPIYDAYWDEAATRYGVGIERFSQLIKGTTMRYILDKYFADRTEAFKRMVAEESDAFERTMPFPPLPGALEFLRALRERGTHTGLVTSSEEEKVRRILTVMPLEGMFDTIVHAGRVKRGKPAPDCYLLAASDLGVRPADCLVFEDSLNGIQAGNAAGMRVIGVASTNPPEALRDKVFDVIPDFKGKTFDDFLRWQA